MATFTGTNGDDQISPTTVSPGVGRSPAGSFPSNLADLINGQAGDDVLNGGGGDDRIFGGNGNDDIYGGAGNDYLHGTVEGSDGSEDYALDELFGGAGNDTLVGGGAGTAMTGGTGNDTYYFQGVFDWAYESAGGGTDTAILRVDMSDILDRLNDNVENLTLAEGYSIATAYGNNLNNVITGNSGGNALYGFEGNDTLIGGGGADRMEGGSGNDTYFVERVTDTVVETSATGGRDEVSSSVSYTLGANVEDLVLTGSAATNGVGNGLGNGISGNNAANILSGLGGADTLFGGAGNDTLLGGDGADLLFGSTGADVLIGGAGADTFEFPGTNYSPPAARDILRAGDGAPAFDNPGADSGDRIDLSGIDANTGVGGDQAFLLGTATGAGRVWLTNSGGNTIVNANVDGDATVEFQLAIEDGSTPASFYNSADFVL